MKRIAGCVATLALLLAGCSDADTEASVAATTVSPDADACSSLVGAWTKYATGDAVMSLNDEDLTATRWEDIYNGGKALVADQSAVVASLTEPDIKSAWTDWEQRGSATFVGIESGDTMAVSRRNVAEWAAIARRGVAACGSSAPLPTLSSSAPSIGG